MLIGLQLFASNAKIFQPTTTTDHDGFGWNSDGGSTTAAPRRACSPKDRVNNFWRDSYYCVSKFEKKARHSESLHQSYLLVTKYLFSIDIFCVNFFFINHVYMESFLAYTTRIKTQHQLVCVGGSPMSNRIEPSHRHLKKSSSGLGVMVRKDWLTLNTVLDAHLSL